MILSTSRVFILTGILPASFFNLVILTFLWEFYPDLILFISLLLLHQPFSTLWVMASLTILHLRVPWAIIYLFFYVEQRASRISSWLCNPISVALVLSLIHSFVFRSCRDTPRIFLLNQPQIWGGAKVGYNTSLSPTDFFKSI